MIRSPIAPTSRRRPSRIVALVVFGAVLLGACANPAPPSPSASASPSPSTTASPSPSSAAPSASAVAEACAGADITATGGPWGGAAGSRGSDISVESSGAAACLLPASPTIALVDQAGTVLLTNTLPQPGSGPEIAPNGTAGFSLLFSNWCDQGVSLPLHFQLALAGDTIDIDGLAVSTTDDLPPCNGPGQPATLSTTDWEPS